MNYKIIYAFLGFVSLLLGACMLACVPWGLAAFGGGPAEGSGIRGLYQSAVVCFVIGIFFSTIGRGADTNRLYLREAFACVALSWFLAVLLGALPYLLSDIERIQGTAFTLGDAIFESASGITTTGGTVFEDLENPETLPRCILFWRSLTHFIGGIGVMCCFVVFLGKGASGKAVLKVEHLFAGNLPFAKMRSLAKSLFAIYMAILCACLIWYLICGMSFYDAISHAFSVAALGGFSTHNESLGYFKHTPGVNQALLEYGTIVFMFVSGTNYWLLLWACRGSFSKLFHDVEWRFYTTSILVVGVAATAIGIWQGEFVFRGTPMAQALSCEEAEVADGVPGVDDNEEFSNDDLDAAPYATADSEFDAEVDAYSYDSSDDLVAPATVPLESQAAEDLTQLRECSKCPECAVVCNSVMDAFRKTLFHTVSLMTSMGFATGRYECANAPTVLLFICVMFIGGCSGSPAGGVKVNRAILAFRLLQNEEEKQYRPNVVRVTKLGGNDVDSETAYGALKYLAYFAMLVVITTLVVSAIETDAMWITHDRPRIEKLFDIFGGTLAMFGNVGLAFGDFGSTGNYSGLTEVSKFIFSWAMIVGRLEIWCVLAVFSRKFWRNR